MIASELLTQWVALSHPERMYRAYELGRDLQNQALIDELERGDSFSRRLAVQTIQGSRDMQRAYRLTSDESRLVRQYAIKVLARYGDISLLEPVFLAGNQSARRAIIKGLVELKRREVVDGLCLALQREGGDWQLLAPYASHAFLETHFDEAFVRAGYVEWARLTRQHPRFALEKLLVRAENAKERDNSLLYHAKVALGVLGERESDLALQLIQSLLKHVALSDLVLDDLLAQRPEAVAQIVLARDDKTGLNFGRFASRLKFETLRELLIRHPQTLNNSERWLRRIPLEWRAKLWEEFGLGWRVPIGSVSLGILQLLPRAYRQIEGLRHLELPTLAAKPELWLPYAALLEHGDALERIQPLLGDPDPDLRVAAHRALAQNVRFARQFVGELIERVQKRGFEQDPVRAAMLSGLAQLPPSIWREEHLPVLETIQRQALDARDLSATTASQLERLFVGILPHFPAWAASRLAILVKERGHVTFWNLESRLTDEQMKVVGPQILPTLQSWVQREHGPLLGAMRSLGRRLKVWDEGAKLLADFAKNGPTSMAASAASILSEFRPHAFAELVPQLLKIDASWGVQAVVYNHIHRRRQDLWTPALLGREKPRGRFWTGKTRFVLPLSNGFERWNPGQQALWAQTLEEVINDASRDTPSAIIAIQRLAELPDILPKKLLELASLQNPKAVTRETALRVLSRLDAGHGVPLLIEALDDERARFAIYSLRRALLEMPQERALKILRATPLVKVTVAKEVVRLLGDLKTEEAFALLLDFATRELHRDVRIALLRGLWEHLEDERVWPILESAAASDDPAVARMAARTTALRISKEVRFRLNTLRVQLLGHPETRVRLEVLTTLQSGATDPEKVLREPLFRSLESAFPSEYSTAAAAIWATYSEKDIETVVQAITGLLPRRRALKAVVDTFAARAQYSPSLSRALGRAMVQALAGDPLLLTQRLRLAFDVLPASEFAALVENETQNGTLHAGVLFELVDLLQTVYLWGSFGSVLKELQTRWESSVVPEMRRLALAALVNLARDAKGWTKDRLDTLEILRLDESPLVASAAQWVFPPGIEE